MAKQWLVAGSRVAATGLKVVVARVEVCTSNPEQDDLRAPQALPCYRVRLHFAQQLVTGLAVGRKVGDMDDQARSAAHECGVAPDPSASCRIALSRRIGVA